MALIIVVLGQLALASPALGDGELDPTFDGDGRVVTDLDRGHEVATGVAVQADGKIVAAGDHWAGGTSTFDFAVVRYNPDGSLDATFAGDGSVFTDFGSTDVTSSVAIQGDGKIVVAGRTFAGPNADNFALARYNPDGSLDTSFDNDGRVVSDFGASDAAYAVAIQNDGKIVAAGQGGVNSADFELARYNPDGSLDASFGASGMVLTDFFRPSGGAGHSDRANGLAIQPDGKIVAAGTSSAGAQFDNFAAARYNPDGSLDPTFDGDGRALPELSGDEMAWAMTLQPDGKIVAAGQMSAVNDADFELVRFNANGSLDPTFDGDGRVVTDFGVSRYDVAFAVASQADGKVVAVGTVDSRSCDCHMFAVVRYNPDGTLDLSFDGDGLVLTDFGGALVRIDQAHALAIQADGKLVVAGERSSGGGSGDFALARYLAGPPRNNPPDCSRVIANPATLRLPNHQLRLVSLSGATDPDGQIVALTITAVTQDEPLNGNGDGDTSPDARRGTKPKDVLIRSERSGRGDGRVYRIAFTGSDGSGGTCAGTAMVRVPLNGTAQAIDSAPPSFNSFGP